MTANPWSGEVEIVLDGKAHRAKLTLGALAALEAELERGALVDLIERFEAGRFTARDVMAVLAAGLRGGGWQGSVEALMAAEIEGGVPGAVAAAVKLLARAFGADGVENGQRG